MVSGELAPQNSHTTTAQGIDLTHLGRDKMAAISQTTF